MSTAIIIISVTAVADSGDDTLRYYLSKATLVVSGEITDEPHIRYSAPGAADYAFRLKVKKILKGDTENEELIVGLIRFQLKDGDSPTFLKKGMHVILFLKATDNNPGVLAWLGVDPWFGAQQYNSIMERSLERLVNK